MNDPASRPTSATGRSPWLIPSLLIAAVLLAGNVVAYLLYRRAPAPVAAPTTVEPLTPPPSNPSEGDVARLAAEQRKRGIEALEAEDYDRALRALEASKTLAPQQSDIDALISVARKLGGMPGGQAEVIPREPAPAAEPEPQPETETEAPPRRREVRRRAVRSAAPRPTEPGLAHVLVTSTPEGLLVHVDGKPKDLTPTRIPVTPGRHSIELRQGEEIVALRSVEVGPGEVAVVSAAATTKASADLGADESLDLVALLDRDAPGKEAADAPGSRSPSAPAGAAGWRPTEGSQAPRLLVYSPSGASADMRSALRAALPGAEVRAVSSAGELDGRIPADAVLAPRGVLETSGLSPALVAGRAPAFTLAGFDAAKVSGDVSGLTVGVVSELDRKAMPAFVASVLGTSRAPNLRRVAKTEDLLSTLQLGMAEVVLVRAADLAVLERRTQQTLHTRALGVTAPKLAVAFVPGGRGASLRAGLERMDGASLRGFGFESWTTP